MYSLSTRLNSVFFYFVICLAILCSFNILTTIFMYQPPVINKFEIAKMTSLYNHPYTRVQHSNGVMNFDLDFTPCYNWNSHLVFAWITARYKTGSGKETSVTIWDNIMDRYDTVSQKVAFERKGFEYPLIDTYKSLPSKEVMYELHWEHMPVVGPIMKYKLPLTNHTLPEKLTQQPGKSIMNREIDYEDRD